MTVFISGQEYFRSMDMNTEKYTRIAKIITENVHRIVFHGWKFNMAKLICQFAYFDCT